MKEILISQIDLNNCTKRVDERTGCMVYVFKINEDETVQQKTSEVKSKKEICLDLMISVVNSGGKLVRSEMMKVFMNDERLKFAKPTANTYFYQCVDILKERKIVS